MTRDHVSIVQVGIGGMGAVYVAELLKGVAQGRVALAGVVDPDPGRCPRLSELHALGVPLFADLETFYRFRGAELAIISSPHQVHAAQTILALEHGSRVLCEKPAAAVIQEARAMIDAERRTGLWTAVAFQWSFSEAVQALKADIREGAFGRPRRLKCLYTWPRDRAYYGRNAWAGRRRTPDGGWILDGPAHNAMAHDLHNMFYILGPEVGSCAFPGDVQAELYRAYPLENYDTAAARFKLENGAEILLWFSHAACRDRGPVLRYEFERGTVAAEGRGSDLKAVFSDGTHKNYGNPDAEPMKKFWDALNAVGLGTVPVCGTEAASGQVLAVNGMQESSPEIGEFPAARLREESRGASSQIWIDGLDEALERAFTENALPSELGFPWARTGKTIDLRGYGRYPSFS